MHFKRYIALFLLFAFSLLFAPVEAVHQLLEEHHSEVHLCHSDHCVRAFTAHCDLCDLQSPPFYSWKESNAQRSISKVTIAVRLCAGFPQALSYLIPPNKAPPVS
jgi:hypothetical protein